MNAGDVLASRRCRGHDERRAWEVRTDALRRILKLEAVADDQVIALRALLPEVLVELGGSPGLNVTDLSAEAIADPHQAAVRPGVPRLIGDRSRGEQRDAEPRPIARGSSSARRQRVPTLGILSRTSERDAKEQRREPWRNVERCG
jgi:hypothetical protein